MDDQWLMIDSFFLLHAINKQRRSCSALCPPLPPPPPLCVPPSLSHFSVCSPRTLLFLSHLFNSSSSWCVVGRFALLRRRLRPTLVHGEVFLWSPWRQEAWWECPAAAGEAAEANSQRRERERWRRARSEEENDSTIQVGEEVEKNFIYTNSEYSFI